jgi:diguanylate cyclase (GGDEF)-like protein
LAFGAPAPVTRHFRIDMTDYRPVFASLALQLVLYMLAWVGASRLISTAHAAARQWAGAYGLSAIALWAAAAGPNLGPWVQRCLSGVLLVLAFTALVRGARHFFRMRLRDGEHLTVLILAALALFSIGPHQSTDGLRAGVLAGVVGFILLRTMIGAWEAAAEEFGPAGIWMLFGPPLVLDGLLALAAWRPWGATGGPFGIAWPIALLALAAVMSFAQFALVVWRLVRALRHESRTDALTGLLHRSAMREPLDHAWSLYQRGEQVFSLLMIDIDHLHRINDSAGLEAGDKVIAMVAGFLQTSRRPADRTARFGGEEFLVLLPQADADGAMAKAERLRRFIAGAHPPGTLPPVTVSIGIATAAPGDATIQSLIERAERAVGAAKRAGRNRVMVDAGLAVASEV